MGINPTGVQVIPPTSAEEQLRIMGATNPRANIYARGQELSRINQQDAVNQLAATLAARQQAADKYKTDTEAATQRFGTVGNNLDKFGAAGLIGSVQDPGLAAIINTSGAAGARADNLGVQKSLVDIFTNAMTGAAAGRDQGYQTTAPEVARLAGTAQPNMVDPTSVLAAVAGNEGGDGGMSVEVSPGGVPKVTFKRKDGGPATDDELATVTGVAQRAQRNAMTGQVSGNSDDKSRTVAAPNQAAVISAVNAKAVQQGLTPIGQPTVHPKGTLMTYKDKTGRTISYVVDKVGNAQPVTQ